MNWALLFLQEESVKITRTVPLSRVFILSKWKLANSRRHQRRTAGLAGFLAFHLFIAFQGNSSSLSNK